MNPLHFLGLNGDAIFYVVGLVGSMLWLNRRRLFGKLGAAKTGYVDETSFIMAFFTQGHSLKRLKRSKTEDLRYNAFMTMPSQKDAWAGQNTSPGSVLYMLELPFHTRGHVIGISKKSKVDRYFLESYLEAHGMKQIVLEGDYPAQFSLYAAPGQEVVTRYILDPAAMAFTVDYCSNHFWEVVGDEMYFATVSGLKGSGSILEDSVRFVKQIRPATADSENNQRLVKHEVPYGMIGNKPLNCPICSKEMKINRCWYACKNKHGILLQGPDLSKIKNKIHKVEKNNNLPAQHEGLHCPNCSQKMHPVDYLHTGVIIDSCVNCVYRWLDSGEAYKISQPKHSLSPHK